MQKTATAWEPSSEVARTFYIGMLPSQARKKRELFDFPWCLALSLAYDPAVRYISSEERKTDESLRRNIIMAKSAHSTQNCSVASRAGAIPRIHAEKGRQAKGRTVYRGLPDSHRAPPRNDFAPQGRT